MGVIRAFTARAVQNNQARKRLLYYISQIFMLASPIVVLPYLGHVVGPTGLGLYGSGQGLALIATTFVEFNMLQSGSRQAAVIRDDLAGLRQLTAAVFGAKLIMTVVAICLGAALFPFISMMRLNAMVFAAALAFGIAQGHTVYWFFGGTDNLQFIAVTDVLGRILSVIAVFLFVHSPGQLWIVFLAQMAGSCFGIAAGITFITIKFSGIVKPDLVGGTRIMRANIDLFMQNVIGNIYSGSTALVMSLVAPPAIIGYFSAGERIMRGATLPSSPLRQTFFPRISAMVHSDPVKSAFKVRQLLIAAGTFNLFVLSFLVIFGPYIVQTLFGPQFVQSAKILEILAALPFLYIFTDILGNLWLIPLHHDRYCTFVVFISALIHIAGVIILTIFWGAMGAAIAMLFANIVAATLILGKVLSLRIHPFHRL